MNTGHTERITVGVVYGGRSSEHEVSCVSAGAVMSHLDPETYDVVPIGITRDGMWTIGESDPSALTIRDGVLPTVVPGEELALSLDPAKRGLLRNVDTGEVHARIDVIFPVLHGRFGEDGTIQGLLELAGIPYVGTGVLSSACGMDKEFTKKLAAAEGLPITAEVILRGTGTDLDEAQQELLGLPVFVKPARGGSSIGIVRITEPEQLEAAIADEPRFIADRRELDRAGPSYTVDTLESLAAVADGFRLVAVYGEEIAEQLQIEVVVLDNHYSLYHRDYLSDAS